ncbi:MAG TPA: sulfatase-like hydrolase/transferase, partial [Terriglobia bacterium]|nr:sulfatase-like hydrolase/transferase [Terriglobia bacterium]
MKRRLIIPLGAGLRLKAHSRHGEFGWRIALLCAGLCFLSLLAFTSCNSSHQTQSEAQAKLRPLNVVVITIDTLRPDHLHCYGYRDIQTPTLDALAERGVLFEQAVAQAPLTLPSHASIFTGEYPTRHHVRDTGGFVLPASSVTLAKILQQQGWDTAAFVGSAVLKKNFGFNLGFGVYDDQMP